MNDGISLMQPPHFVAQRSSRTALPLKLESETALPPASSKTKSGADLRADGGSRGTRTSAAWESDNAARQIMAVRMGLQFSVVCRLPAGQRDGSSIRALHASDRVRIVHSKKESGALRQLGRSFDSPS